MEPSRPSWIGERAGALLDRFGSPLYVFHEGALRANYRAMRRALDEHYPESSIHFAAKANYNLGVLSVLRDAGCGAEAYARCELTAVREAGFAPEDVLLTGMNRRRSDVERALEWGVERLLVDNEVELARVAAAAEAVGTTPDVLVRCNPAMTVPTHPEIATATRESKFGIDVASGRAMAVARDVAAADGLRLAGLQLHVGSQVTGVEPYREAAGELLTFAAAVADELGVEVPFLDLGGGFPVPYEGDAGDVPGTAAIVEALAETVRAGCEEHGLPEPTLLLEPGRRLVADAGTLLGTVGVVKKTPHATFAVLDVGTNAVSGAWPYPIYPAADDGPTREYHVAGPLCYSGDVLAEGVALPELSRGDVLAVDRIGAYSLGSASHTNAEPKPAVVLVGVDGTPRLVRERETCEDVLGGDRIPVDLARDR
jgi:diaminopimelate decarboxylase